MPSTDPIQQFLDEAAPRWATLVRRNVYRLGQALRQFEAPRDNTRWINTLFEIPDAIVKEADVSINEWRSKMEAPTPGATPHEVTIGQSTYAFETEEDAQACAARHHVTEVDGGRDQS